MNEYLSVCDIANILKLSELTIRRYLKSKKLTGLKVGRFWRIEKEALDRFISESSDEEVGGGGKGDNGV
jgi:excisionase family DNA binding protein